MCSMLNRRAWCISMFLACAGRGPVSNCTAPTSGGDVKALRRVLRWVGSCQAKALHVKRANQNWFKD